MPQVDADPTSVSADWLDWLRDFEEASRDIARSVTADVDEAAELERQSTSFALYARAITIVGTCRILADADKLLDLRVNTRGVVECAMHLAAIYGDPGHLDALKEDDRASRRSRAKAFVKRQSIISKPNRDVLEAFMAATKDAKRLNLSDLPDVSMSALPHEFREISADATHVTFTSLARHVQTGSDGVNRLVIDPGLTGEELAQTLRVLALACLSSTWFLLRGCLRAQVDTGALEDLGERFSRLCAHSPVAADMPADTQPSGAT